METLFIMLKNVIIFVLLAVPGYLLVRGKLLAGLMIIPAVFAF